MDYRLRDEALIERARLAVQRALPLVKLTHHAGPLWPMKWLWPETGIGFSLRD